MIIPSNKISIDFKDAEYGANSAALVHNAMEGRISHAGIEYTKDCTVQKEMGKRIVYTGTEQETGAEVIVKNLQGTEFDPADFISQSMTGKDAADVEEDGTILEEYVASSLERAVERVKGQRREREAATEKQVERVGEQKEHFEKMEQRIMEASRMASQVSGMSEAVAQYFLKNNLPVTPENLQSGNAVAAHSSVPAQDSFDIVRAQAEEILVRDNLELNEQNLETAQWLYENDVPVTGETIRDAQMLQELKDVSPETLTQRIVDEMVDGIRPEAADLSHISREEARQKRDALIQVSENELRQVFSSDAEIITAKRQLEEIRLTMTIDAARTMENKGIHLDVHNLMEIVEELRAMEQEATHNILQEAGVEATEESTSQAAQTLRAAADIMEAPAAVFGRTIDRVDISNLGDVAAFGNQMRLEMDISDEYEKVGTEVRRDLGDSITKAFCNVDDILTELGLDVTAANQRSVRILAYNRMPLTEENIQSMKQYDDKVTTLVKSLRPQVVAELIRRQENPMEMSLDELSEAVSEITEEIGQDDVSVRKYLWKLEHNGSISEDERKSMIGIYRLLDKVEKSQGAVIGQVVKEGRELSFSSLLSAVRSRRAKGIDKSIDDEFGGLEEIRQSGESISSQIDAAFAERMVQKLQKSISPAVLHKRGETYMMDSLEVVLDDCVGSEESMAENERYYSEVAVEIREMAAQSDEQLMTCLRQMNLPDSLVNIQLMRAYLEHGGRDFLKWYSKEDSEKIIDSFDEPEKLQEVFDEIDEVHKADLEKQKESDEIRYEDVREIARMAGSVSFYKQMRRFQRYEVPVVTEQGVTACSVTVRQGRESEKGTVEISMDSPVMGQLQATFRVSGNRVSGFVTGEQETAQDVSAELLDGLEKDLEVNGFTMEHGNFANGRRNSFHSGEDINQTATNDRLYLVAKLFIQNVQRKEDKL